jgi:hypothetical protein
MSGSDGVQSAIRQCGRRATVLSISHCGLDSKNQLHWRMLMNAFCWSHYPPERLVGRPPWKDAEYGQLLADAAQTRTINAPRKLYDRTIRKALLKRFKERYEKMSEDRVRKRLAEARNPDYHGELARRLYPDLTATYKKHTSEGLEWTPKHEAAHQVVDRLSVPATQTALIGCLGAS